jgi:hypothetical protein
VLDLIAFFGQAANQEIGNSRLIFDNQNMASHITSLATESAAASAKPSNEKHAERRSGTARKLHQMHGIHGHLARCVLVIILSVYCTLGRTSGDSCPGALTRLSDPTTVSLGSHAPGTGVVAIQPVDSQCE